MDWSVPIPDPVSPIYKTGSGLIFLKILKSSAQLKDSPASQWLDTPSPSSSSTSLVHSNYRHTDLHDISVTFPHFGHVFFASLIVFRQIDFCNDIFVYCTTLHHYLVIYRVENRSPPSTTTGVTSFYSSISKRSQHTSLIRDTDLA